MTFTIERALAEEPEEPTQLAEPWIIDSDVGCSWTYIYPTPLDPDATVLQRRRAVAAVARAFTNLAVLERQEWSIPLDLVNPPGVADPDFVAHAGELDFRVLMVKLQDHAHTFTRLDMQLWLYLWIREEFGYVERRVIRDGAIVSLGNDEFAPLLKLSVFFTHGLFAPWLDDIDNCRVARHNQPTLRHILGTLNEALPEWRKSWDGKDYERMGPEGYELPPPAPDEDEQPWEDWMGELRWFHADGTLPARLQEPEPLPLPTAGPSLA